MIKRIFQDLCAAERKIREDAEQFVATENFSEIVNLAGMQKGYIDAAREIPILSRIQRKSVMKLMLKDLK